MPYFYMIYHTESNFIMLKFESPRGASLRRPFYRFWYLFQHFIQFRASQKAGFPELHPKCKTLPSAYEGQNNA
jgi:hypothetical protein